MSEDTKVSILVLILFVVPQFVFLTRYFLKRDTWQLRDLPQHSPLVLLLLAPLSLFSYYVYWYLKVSYILNRSSAVKPISKNFQIFSVLLFIGSLASTALADLIGFSFESNDGRAFDRLFSISMSICFIIWGFEIKRLLENQLRKKLNPILTFFFGMIYLQDKLLQISISSKRSDEAPE